MIANISWYYVQIPQFLIILPNAMPLMLQMQKLDIEGRSLPQVTVAGEEQGWALSWAN